jgi:hypothetical protein
MIGRAMQGRFGKLAATEKRGYLSTTVEKAERLACEKADAMVASLMVELPSVAPFAKAKLQALHGRVAEQDRRAFLKVNHGINVYPVQVMTRKSLGLMTRKLSVTESHIVAQLRGTFSRRKPSVASANWVTVA